MKIIAKIIETGEEFEIIHYRKWHSIVTLKNPFGDKKPLNYQKNEIEIVRVEK